MPPDRVREPDATKNPNLINVHAGTLHAFTDSVQATPTVLEIPPDQEISSTTVSGSTMTLRYRHRRTKRYLTYREFATITGHCVSVAGTMNASLITESVYAAKCMILINWKRSNDCIYTSMVTLTANSTKILTSQRGTLRLFNEHHPCSGSGVIK